MNEKRIFLIRHGETDWNRKKIWQGLHGPGLNEAGRKQIENTAFKLKNSNISELYSSDVTRALETSQIISSYLGLRLKISPAFRERDMGDYTGLAESEVLKRNPGLVLQNGFLGSNDLPTVEKWDSFVRRVTEGIESLISHVEGDAAAVTHGGVIYIALAHFDHNKLLPVVPNGNVSVIMVKPDVFIENIYL
ncbi:phosphoglycerate mutase [mine drainage metagenome]|uniref:Phosphoglycerate mutase n=1 Tax=mine drainage metagenome TaxID=410659 RepID=T1A554_9ZZZZ